MIKNGDKFGKLTVLCLSHTDEKHRKYYWCECECGALIIAHGSSLKSGHKKSCTECLRPSNLKHGMSGTRFYRTWTDMKNRCLNPNIKAYHRYGGRGISLCEKWKDFTGFMDDMYDSYTEHYSAHGNDTSLDRINNDDNYYKENCRWVTNIEQQWNRSDNVKVFDDELGTTVSRRYYCIRRGLDPDVVKARIRRGYSFEEAIQVPFKSKYK